MGFEGYSFCKPHSASYTLVAYKSAFLRAHYPAEFMAAVLSNGGGYYATFGYLSEAKRMGLQILPPDINESEIPYTGQGRKIRVGLMALMDLSQESKEAILHVRSKNGPFSSLQNFMNRTAAHVHLQDTRILIKAGCFDSIAHGTTRAALMWQALCFFNQDKTATQVLLFETNPTPSIADPPAHFPSPYPKHLMLKHEMETLGFLLSIHPLDRYKDMLERLDHVKACDLHAHVGERVTTVGWQITGKTVQTVHGHVMKFVSFEDQTGIYETVLFPKVYHQCCHMLNATRPYILKGKVEEAFGAITLTVQRIGFLASGGLTDNSER